MLDKHVSFDYLTCGESVTNWRQSLQEQFSHIISDFQAICLGIDNISTHYQISLIYEVQHSQVLQFEASDPASVFPLVGYTEEGGSFYTVVEILFVKHPQYQRLEFTGQHYTKVAEHFMRILRKP